MANLCVFAQFWPNLLIFSYDFVFFDKNTTKPIILNNKNVDFIEWVRFMDLLILI